MKKILTHSLIILGCLIIAVSCKINYSFTGAALSADVKTFSVGYFPNRAPLVNPTLSDYFTEELRDKLSRQTSLDNVTEGGDLEFSGSITGYDVKPMAIQEGDLAAQNRLTVKISVNYINNKDHEKDFESTFSAYADFSSTQIISDVEDELIETIIEQINEDIFNKSIASW